jgi:hypothetical protein
LGQERNGYKNNRVANFKENSKRMAEKDNIEKMHEDFKERMRQAHNDRRKGFWIVVAITVTFWSIVVYALLR